jgi:RNA polymerase sigma-70 factor (ECF subfamily)
MDEPGDGPLIDAARAGDASAIETLVTRYQPRLLRFGLKMCRHAEDAKDVLQESLFAAVRALPSFRGDASLATWLYAIARGVCIKKRRRSVFAPAAVLSLEGEASADARRLPDGAHLPDDALHGSRLADALDAAIAALEPGQREVLLLRDVEGFTAPQVADITGLGVPAVKSRLHRARLAVRARLAPLVGATGGASAACPDIEATFSRFLEGEIRPDTCAEMERHLAACPACRERCDALKRTLGACAAVPVPEVPRDLQESIREGMRRLLDRA